MMMLAKLKAVAVFAVTALVLTTGLGVGLVPAAAGDEPGRAPDVPARAKAGVAPAAPPNALDDHIAGRSNATKLAPDPAADDTTFLRRLCLDVRGTPPTDVEEWFFVSDGDDDKRAKLVDWMTEDDAAKLALAKKLGVPPERVTVVRARLSADGRYVELVADSGDTKPATPYRVNINAEMLRPGSVVVLDQPASVGNKYRSDVTLKLLGKDDAAIRAWLDVTVDVKDAKKNPVSRQAYTWKRVAAGNGLAIANLFQGVPAQQFQLWDFDTDGKADRIVVNELYAPLYAPLDVSSSLDSDAVFLKRVLLDVRGNGPTALELKYFTEDKDPKKREKLIDTLLKEPAVQKKLGDEWKKKVLAPTASTAKATDQIFYYVMPDGNKNSTWIDLFNPAVQPKQPSPPAAVKPLVPRPPTPPVTPKPPEPPAPPQVDKLSKLVGELIAAKKSDEAVLEAVTLATLSRLPTDSERRLVLASIGTAADRNAAWVAVAKALTGAENARPGEPYRVQIRVEPPTPPAPPVPPARP